MILLSACLWIPEEEPWVQESEVDPCILGCDSGLVSDPGPDSDTGSDVDTDTDTDSDSDTGPDTDTDIDTGSDTGSDTDSGGDTGPEAFVDKTTIWGSEILAIPAGTFSAAGSWVTLTHDFWIGQTELTQAQWEAEMGTDPSYHVGCGSCPVEEVNWIDAALYCNALSAAEGLETCYLSDGTNLDPVFGGDPYLCSGYRLPTGAEWEYTAQAGEGTEYAGSDDVDAVAWYDVNSGGATHEVASLASNAWKLYDMSGNVWEWTHDRVDETGSYTLEGTDPSGSDTGDTIFMSGGSYEYSAWNAAILTTGGRFGTCYYLAEGSDSGFRLARSAP